MVNMFHLRGWIRLESVSRFYLLLVKHISLRVSFPIGSSKYKKKSRVYKKKYG